MSIFICSKNDNYKKLRTILTHPYLILNPTSWEGRRLGLGFLCWQWLKKSHSSLSFSRCAHTCTLILSLLHPSFGKRKRWMIFDQRTNNTFKLFCSLHSFFRNPSVDFFKRKISPSFWNSTGWSSLFFLFDPKLSTNR